MNNTRRPQTNQKQNKQFSDAAATVGLTDKQLYVFRRIVEHESRVLGANLDFNDLCSIAKEVKGET